MITNKNVEKNQPVSSSTVLKELFKMIRSDAKSSFSVAILATISQIAADASLPYFLVKLYQDTGDEQSQDEQDQFNDAYKDLIFVLLIWTTSYIAYTIKNNAIARITSNVSQKFCTDIYNAISDKMEKGDLTSEERDKITGIISMEKGDLTSEERDKITGIISNARQQIHSIMHDLLDTPSKMIEIIVDCGVLWYYYGTFFGGAILGASIVSMILNVILSHCIVSNYPDQSADENEKATKEFFTSEFNNKLSSAQKKYIANENRNDFVKVIQTLIIALILGGATVFMSLEVQKSIVNYTLDDFEYVMGYILAIGLALSGAGDILKTLKSALAILKSGIDLIHNSNSIQRPGPTTNTGDIESGVQSEDYSNNMENLMSNVVDEKTQTPKLSRFQRALLFFGQSVPSAPEGVILLPQQSRCAIM